MAENAGLCMNQATFRSILASVRYDMGYPARRGRLPAAYQPPEWNTAQAV